MYGKINWGLNSMNNDEVCLIKKPYLITVNTVYIIVSVIVLSFQFFSTTFKLTYTFYEVSDSVQTQISKSFILVCGAIVMVCFIFYSCLLLNFFMYHKNKVYYKSLLPVNLITLLLNFVIMICVVIKRISVINASFEEQIKFSRNTLQAAYFDFYCIMTLIITVSVIVNIFLYKYMKKKHQYNIKSMIIGMSISGFPLLSEVMLMLINFYNTGMKI